MVVKENDGPWGSVRFGGGFGGEGFGWLGFSYDEL